MPICIVFSWKIIPKKSSSRSHFNSKEATREITETTEALTDVEGIQDMLAAV